MADWRERAGTLFTCEKRPVTGARGLAVTNHPLASAAATEMLAAGGNAVDAAVAALFTLSVVEPMMVGIFGGGTALLRLASGETKVIDGYALAPARARPDSFTPLSDSWPDYMEVEGRANALGPQAIAVPGNLMAWCEMRARFGRLPLAEVMAPAIRHAAQGFRVTPYLAVCAAEVARDLARDAAIASLFLPHGKPIEAGQRLVQTDYAATLEAISNSGPELLYGGALGRTAAAYLEKAGGFLRLDDLASYRTIEREPVRGTYRGIEITGAPPPASGAIHTIQILNLLESFDLARLGFGTAETLHLVLEALKIAAADRSAATADPAFVTVPLARLTAKSYANERRGEIDPARAGTYPSRVLAPESAHTTHVTIADDEGTIVSATQTINSLFGARILIPGTGIIPNNYMYLFDPHPGHALSLEPGKRITSSMTPLIAYRAGAPLFALGLPGGPRIPAAALQAVLNLIDHGMDLQEAVEAPRVFTQGQEVECERAIPESVRQALRARGHEIVPVDHVAGGMCAIAFAPDGMMSGAACWRADGTPMAVGGGLARAGVSFWPDPARRR